MEAPSPAPAPRSPQHDGEGRAGLATLTAMGFSISTCRDALRRSGGDLQAAAEDLATRASDGGGGSAERRSARSQARARRRQAAPPPDESPEAPLRPPETAWQAWTRLWRSSGLAAQGLRENVLPVILLAVFAIKVAGLRVFSFKAALVAMALVWCDYAGSIRYRCTGMALLVQAAVNHVGAWSDEGGPAELMPWLDWAWHWLCVLRSNLTALSVVFLFR